MVAKKMTRNLETLGAKERLKNPRPERLGVDWAGIWRTFQMPEQPAFPVLRHAIEVVRQIRTAC
jgi:hypothetical protein